MKNLELKPCPFCGGKAAVTVETEKFQIVGCHKISMLCPNPSMTAYKDSNGDFDYTHWNTRASI